ncbi:hypothetical protein D3C74_239220 [compost metagenome]
MPAAVRSDNPADDSPASAKSPSALESRYPTTHTGSATSVIDTGMVKVVRPGAMRVIDSPSSPSSPSAAPFCNASGSAVLVVPRVTPIDS